MSTIRQIQENITLSPEWVEINTFECPMGRVTPEKCVSYRMKDEMPEPCRTCTIYPQKCREVREKRQQLIKEMERATYENWENRWKKVKETKVLKRPETRKYRLLLIEMLLGTVPLNKQLYTDYVAQKYLNKDKVMDEETKKKRIEEEENMLEEVIEKGTTGFFRDEKGIYIMDYHIKGFLKEAGNILKDILGIRNLRSKIDNYVFVLPRKIYLAPAPSGWYERPLRAMTMQGPRVSLARSEVVDAGISFEIEIMILPNKEINFNVIEALLDYGRYKGLGQWRNARFGTFLWFPADSDGVAS